jgi:UDPglucose--hexose-1-phosphate uridylyltransferase
LALPLARRDIPMSEIRHNRLTGEWVIIAPERAKRGGNLGALPPPVTIPAFDPACPFCPGNEGDGSGERHRIDDADGRWLIRSVVNKFSVLSATGEVASPGCAGKNEETVNGVGLHEVLVETPEHHRTMAQFPVAHLERILTAYRHRFRTFYADPRIRHVILFKNHGADAGASQQHAHSQIVGLPIVPGQVVDRLERSRRFFLEDGKCLVCSLIEEEQGNRVIAENSDFIAFIPYAALSPFHLWIFPKIHAFSFSDLPDAALPTLAEIVHTVLAKIHGLLGNPPFNLVVRSLGPAETDAAHFHWYISIVPRVNKAAGFELGTGMYVNPSSPEVCAKALRDFRVSE